MTSAVLSAVLAPFAGMPGLASAPEGPALPPAPPALEISAADPWADLETRLLAAMGEPLELKTEDFKRAAARAVRDEPSAPLPQSIGRAFGRIHRLSTRRSEAAAELLAQGKDGTHDPAQLKTLFSVDGRLYGSGGNVLKRFAGDGWDELLGLPAGDVFDLQKIDGRLHAAGSQGVYAQKEGGNEWEALASFPATTMARHGGVLFAGSESGLKRLVDGKWVTDPTFRMVGVRHLFERDGKLYASTNMGLYETSPAQEDRILRPSWWARLFGARPTITARKGEPVFGEKPVFDQSMVTHATVVDGRLALATARGMYLSNPDGTWRHELESSSVHRLVQLTDGRTFVVADSAVKQRGPRSWTNLIERYQSDLAALGNVLFVSSSTGLRVLLGLEKGWEEAALKSLEKVSFEEPSKEDKGLVADEKGIRSSSGRSIFGKSDPE
jgi:hypothetical protein